MEKVTVIAFSLGMATILFSVLPAHCNASLLPNGEGSCGSRVVLSIGGSPIPMLTSIGLVLCATEMANKTLRRRSRELKDERKKRRKTRET